MEPTAKRRGRPEDEIRSAIIKFLVARGWYIKIMHGSLYQQGFPDLFCTHKRYGIRLIEVKLPNMIGSKFTPAQMEEFPKISTNGAGIWILTAANDSEYDKLFKPYNWSSYLL